MAARWVMILLAGCSALVAAGCATSVPRFRSHDVEHPSEARSRVSALRRARPAEDAPLPPALNRDRVLLDIVSMLGVPYSYGGSDEAGIDCSGFTALVYDRALGFR
ncbi:MAG TPA: NlpC/P60 family protein, partial [Bacteroidota bacterium]|nr:NlpC/P60 family protein [Bacteroidota bacterium]